MGAAPPAAKDTKDAEPFRFCLNTATIMGQDLPLTQEVDVAAKSGYQAIEPWISKLDKHVKDGGSLKDVAKRIRDLGLVVPSSIGFCEWIVDDDGRRKKGLEEARRSMDLVQQLGGQRLAAPPVGATEQADLNLYRAVDRYRALLELGDKMGVVPMAEVWGFSKSLGRLGEAALVAIETGHPKACVLADVYHLHKGGSGFGGLKLLSGAALQIFHMNDYPADPPREKITDAHRVYPGDGVAPLAPMLRDLRGLGFRGFLSLELFNREYWKQDALTVARTGLEKMRAAVRASME
jgi:sugar phosphate isomerase/epimerase